MNKNRLLWASRRGMLELDLILTPFVENVYDTLSEDDQLRFEVLLESEDQTLFMWFMQRENPDNPDMDRIIKIIMDFVAVVLSILNNLFGKKFLTFFDLGMQQASFMNSIG